MKRHYFTLVELMIVVAILAFLMALVGSNFLDSKDKADRKLALAKIESISGDLDRFKVEHHRYPTTQEGLKALVSKPSSPDIKGYPPHGYIKSMPKDPWGGEYEYLIPGTHSNAYDLWSKGPDKTSGTDDDITNWSKAE